MFAEIIELENIFNNLLPEGQQKGPTPKLLIEAGNNWSAAIFNTAKKLDRIFVTEEEIQIALQFCNRAVFICGSERSGTTLVRNLVDAHPMLSVLPSEGTYITNLEKKIIKLLPGQRAEFLCREWLWRLVILMHVPPFWLLGRSSIEQSPYVEFTRNFITWWDICEARLENKQWPFLALQIAFATTQHKIDELEKMFWVEKTPNNEQHLDRIFNDFPKAKFIQTIRNPIDVLRSNKPHEKISSISKYTFINNLKKTFEIANQQIKNNKGNHLIVRYEQLCETPNIVTQQLASFLEIENMPCLQTPTVVGLLANTNSSFKQDETTGKIMKVKEHKQEDKLTQKDLELLSASLRKLAKPFGYNLQPICLLHKQYLVVETFATRAFNKIKRNIFSNH
jgi:hypothetical protein